MYSKSLGTATPLDDNHIAADPIPATMPNFLVLGAHKAGTTSLHYYLNEHPDVFMSTVLEPGFFVLEARVERYGGLERYCEQLPASHKLMHEKNTARGAAYTIEQYQAMFSGVRGERAIGEKSPIYLTSDQAPERIKQRIPDARLISVLRQPAERAFSHYCMNVRDGSETRTFDEVVDAAIDGAPGSRAYVNFGFYAAAIERYLRFFSREQLQLCLYEELDQDIAGLMRRIYTFLEVDPSFTPNTGHHYNVSARPKPRPKGLVIRAKSVAKRAVKRERPTRLSPLPQPSKPTRFDPPSAASRHLLLDLYREDITRLQDLLSRDLSAWLR